ncbi:MAG TPA: type II secretion system protein [Tepidisphaeraceae bacterium]|nr:type II secretion system protein [Tepidisphaeraceae bacterium]
MYQIQPPRRAFTLVELLTAVGIVAMLTSLLLPALTRARASADDVRDLSNLRQLLLGYTMYYQENKGSLLFGYTPDKVGGVPMSVYDPVSRQTFTGQVADRYPWRLLPYVSNMWKILHSTGDTPPPPRAGEAYGDAFLDAYYLSLYPTYGINSVYVGGDCNFGGFAGPDNTPNAGKYIVFKASEVKHPSRLIVFADCQIQNVTGLQGKGLHVLTPPRANGPHWTVTNEKFNLSSSSTFMGIPKGWYSKRTMVGFFDGHVQSMLPSELTDMRLWANRANSPTYDYTN